MKRVTAGHNRGMSIRWHYRGAGTQIRLLRVLQEQEFEPVGATETRRVDVRLISATHQDLDAQVCNGRFRRICSIASTA